MSHVSPLIFNFASMTERSVTLESI